MLFRSPTPSIVSWKAPSERVRDRFSALAKIASSGLMRQFMSSPVFEYCADFSGFPTPLANYYLMRLRSRMFIHSTATAKAIAKYKYPCGISSSSESAISAAPTNTKNASANTLMVG